jgi:hypothetical protein
MGFVGYGLMDERAFHIIFRPVSFYRVAVDAQRDPAASLGLKKR